MTQDRAAELRRDLQATVTAYRARLSLPPTVENLRMAEELEDELYHAGLALQALGLTGPGGGESETSDKAETASVLFLHTL